MAKKQLIRLTEADLNNLIRESVMQVINENYEDELVGGLRALGNKAMQGVV